MLPPSARKLENFFHPASCERSLTTYPTPQHFVLVVEQYSSIVVQPDDAAVWSSGGHSCADDDDATSPLQTLVAVTKA